MALIAFFPYSPFVDAFDKKITIFFNTESLLIV